MVSIFVKKTISPKYVVTAVFRSPHDMDSSRKNNWPVFFYLSELSPFLELYPFEKIWTKSCQQDILKSIWARGLKLGQLIGDDE